MDERHGAGRVLQMRVAVEASDYEDAVAFYRDVLGAPGELVVEGDQGEKVTILDVGSMLGRYEWMRVTVAQLEPDPNVPPATRAADERSPS